MVNFKEHSAAQRILQEGNAAAEAYLARLRGSESSAYQDFPVYPTDYNCAYLANDAVYRTDFGENESILRERGWELIYSGKNSETGYEGAAYWHSDYRHLVLAHRGTSPSDMRDVQMDIASIIRGNIGGQMVDAKDFSLDVLKKLEAAGVKPTSVVSVGHSLGGWLAQVALAHIQEANEEKRNEDKSQETGLRPRAVVFDSPGANRTIDDIFPKLEPLVDINELIVTSFLAPPNLINSANPPIGTVYQCRFDIAPPAAWNLKSLIRYTKETHDRKKMLEAFDPQTGKAKKVQRMRSWPMVLWRDGKQRTLTLIAILGALKDYMSSADTRSLDSYIEVMQKASRTTIGAEGDLSAELDYQLKYDAQYHHAKLDEYIIKTSTFNLSTQNFLKRYIEVRQIHGDKGIKILHDKFITMGLTQLPVLLEGVRLDPIPNYHLIKILRANRVEKLSDYLLRVSLSYPDFFNEKFDLLVGSALREMLPRVWGLPAENPQFLNRELVKTISEKMGKQAEERNCKVILVAMSGLGGVGKSELAKYYIHNSEKPYNARIWFNADTQEKLETEYRLLAQDLNLGIDKETTNQGVKNKLHTYLAEHPGWIIVVDNADDVNNIQPLLPTRGGDVLVTSRQPHWQGDVITVDVLEEEEAVRFYQRLSNSTDDVKIVKKLVNELGMLPLAIAQAAAFVKQVSLNTEEYLTLFNTNRAKYLSKNRLPGTKEEEVRLTIATTWYISMEAIEQKYSPNDGERFYSRDLLRVCAYLDSHSIPLSFLDKYMASCYPEEQGKYVAYEAIKDLKSYSLIQSDQESVTVHKLVQEVIRNEIKQKKEFSILRRIIDVLLLELENQNITVSDVYNKKSIIHHLGAFLQILYEYISSKLEGILDIQKESIHLFKKLAYIYKLIKDYGRQKSLLEMVLSIQQLLFGDEDKSLVETLYDLALVCGELGDFSQQKIFLEKALLIQKKHGQEIHPLTAQIMSSLSDVYLRENINKAEQFIKEGLIILSRCHGYGSQHPFSMRMREKLEAIERQRYDIFSGSSSRVAAASRFGEMLLILETKNKETALEFVKKLPFSEESEAKPLYRIDDLCMINSDLTIIDPKNNSLSDSGFQVNEYTSILCNVRGGTIRVKVHSSVKGMIIKNVSIYRCRVKLINYPIDSVIKFIEDPKKYASIGVKVLGANIYKWPITVLNRRAITLFVEAPDDSDVNNGMHDFLTSMYEKSGSFFPAFVTNPFPIDPQFTSRLNLKVYEVIIYDMKLEKFVDLLPKKISGGKILGVKRDHDDYMGRVLYFDETQYFNQKRIELNKDRQGHEDNTLGNMHRKIEEVSRENQERFLRGREEIEKMIKDNEKHRREYEERERRGMEETEKMNRANRERQEQIFNMSYLHGPNSNELSGYGFTAGSAATAHNNPFVTMHELNPTLGMYQSPGSSAGFLGPSHYLNNMNRDNEQRAPHFRSQRGHPSAPSNFRPPSFPDLD